MRQSIFAILTVLLMAGCTSGSYDAKVSGNDVFLRNDSTTLRIEWCTPQMFRVSLPGRDGGYYDSDSLMVTNYDWDYVNFDISKRNGEWILTSDALTVKVAQHDFSINVFDKEENLITGSAKAEKELSPFYKNGTPWFANKLFEGEAFFGFGERMDFLNQRGKRLTLDVGRGLGRPYVIGAYNILKANYCPVPFFMSSRGYGLFFHNAYPSEWDLGRSFRDKYTVSAAGGALDYYFIYGPDFASLLNGYTHITGRTPLMPRFAMGLHVGTYSGGTWGHENLTNQNYVVDLASKFRKKDVPADILHLDSTWRLFGKVNGKGGTTFEWRQPGFSNPKAMFDAIYSLNFNMVGLHIRPRLDNTDKNNLLQQAQNLKLTYPEGDYAGDFSNFFDEKSVDWWWKNGLKPVAELGAMFVKTDEGSAFGRQGNELVNKTGPQGDEIPELHNLFPVVYARAPYEKFQVYNNLRGMNHTREGFAGIQRYPFIFAGDWPSEWQYFAPVLRGGINIGLSGVGAWTHCMGGFEHVADPELYIRWCQFGMFSPIAMLFGMEHPNYKEPWNYGKEALTIFTKYDKLRYRLVPYIYSAYYQMYESGMPVMRALVLEYSDDENTYDIDDQYLFGDNLMVCPVTTKGAATRIVYFPKGEWYDYWTGEKIKGNQYKLVVTPIEKLPVYAKAGSIIPMQPDMEYIGEKKVDPLTLHIFPGEKGRYTLYEDDGKSLDYQQGKYATTNIEVAVKGNDLKVVVEALKGEYKAEDKGLVLDIEAVSHPQEVLVTVDGKATELKEVVFPAFEKPRKSDVWAFDEATGELWIAGQRVADKEVVFSVQF
jgi:alpha-glucosidase